MLFSLLPAGIANQSAGVQPYETVQAPQAINTGPIVPHAQLQLSWSRTLIGVGVFLGVGASAAVILKVYLVNFADYLNFSKFLRN